VPCGNPALPAFSGKLLVFRASVFLDPLGEYLHRSVQLQVPPGRIDRIERHLDRRPDAESFETLTIDGDVRNCQQQQVPIVHQEGGSREDSAGGLRTDNLAEVVLLETKGKHLLAAARPGI
jgi:hypothetical protein